MHLINYQVFELKGVKTNNGLSIDSTTKLLEYKLNSDYLISMHLINYHQYLN